MQSWWSINGSLCLLLAVGCGPQEAGDASSSEDDNGATNDATAGTDDGSRGEDGDSTDGESDGVTEDSDGSEGEDNGCEDAWVQDWEDGGAGPQDGEGPPTAQDFLELCQRQVDRESCEAIPSEYYPEQETVWCTWVTWYPVETTGDGLCHVADPLGACMGDSAPEAGCGGNLSFCRRTNPETCDLEVSQAWWCNGCAEFEYCDNQTECTCHPDWDAERIKGSL